MTGRMLPSFFLAGFECAGHRLRSRRRLDLTESTGHGRWAENDYALVAECGLRAARDGFGWPLIERRPGRYDWTSARRAIAAASASGVEVIWDLCHYGVPNGLDIFSDRFVERFAAYAGAAAELVREESEMPPRFCPINEISFWAWAGGEVGYMDPFSRSQGPAMKRQLVRATIAAIDEIRAVSPQAVIVSAEPGICVSPKSGCAADVEAAAVYDEAQFEATDLVLGLAEPQLGGRRDLLDLIGVNFYPHNQWVVEGGAIPMGHYAFQPLSSLLGRWARRYDLPIFLAETGAEGSAGAAWIFLQELPWGNCSPPAESPVFYIRSTCYVRFRAKCRLQVMS